MIEETQLANQLDHADTGTEGDSLPQKIKAINQRIIRRALEEIAAIDHALYEKIEKDPMFELLSRWEHDNPRRREAMLWFLGQLKQVAHLRKNNSPATETLQHIQDDLAHELEGKKSKQHAFPRTRKVFVGQG